MVFIILIDKDSLETRQMSSATPVTGPTRPANIPHASPAKIGRWIDVKTVVPASIWRLMARQNASTTGWTSGALGVDGCC